MKDAKGHGSDKRGGGKVDPRTQAAEARFKARTMRIKRPSGSGGGSGGGGGGGGGSMQNTKHKTGAHTTGIHQATAGKTLATLSSEGTNQNIPAPIIGGRK